MFERDYLMRLILGYFQTILVVVRRSDKEKDPEGAADLLEQAIGEATEIDGDVLLSLSPDSIASILQVSGTDPKVIEYVAQGLLLESHYLMMACDFARAELREQQARALGEAYGIALPDDPAEAEQLLKEAAEQGIIDGKAEGASASEDEVAVGASASALSERADDAAASEADASIASASTAPTAAEAASSLAASAKRARSTAYYDTSDTSVRFDPDAPLMQPELHEAGRFGWQDSERS